MGNKAVSDTGPILHLSEINLIKILDIFSNVIIPDEVFGELNKSRISVPRKIKIISLKSEFKDIAKVLVNQRDLDFGESCAIALVMQEKAEYFLSDDLDARNIAKDYNIEVHGSVGIVLRAFREKIISKKEAIDNIKNLHVKSSLFITTDLVKHIIEEINRFF